MTWTEPITDRTLYDVAIAESYLRGHKTSVLPSEEPEGLKGFITLKDEERLTGNINHLAGLYGLKTIPRTCFRDKKTKLIDFNSVAEFGTLLTRCEDKAKSQGLVLNEVSGTNWFTWQDMNRIERVCKTLKEFAENSKPPMVFMPPSKPPVFKPTDS